MTDSLLTIKELSDFLQIPVGTLYQWRHRGEGPPGLRIGRHVRFKRADVERWVQAQQTRG